MTDAIPAATTIPVLTIDGPSGSGKGTICRLVAQRLGWHFLDSGALYRAVGGMHAASQRCRSHRRTHFFAAASRTLF